MTFYRVRGAKLLFAILLLGAFIPYQVFIYPMVRVFSMIGIYSTRWPASSSSTSIFGLPLMTLLFRNYYGVAADRAVQRGARRRRGIHDVFSGM